MRELLNVTRRLALLCGGCALIACGDSDGGGGGGDAGSTNNGSDASASSVTAGEKLVNALACGSCHQATDGTLSGQTQPQPNTLAYPSNLTPDKATGLGDWTDEQIATAILTGVDDEGQQLCPIMLKYGDLGVSQTDANNVVAYLRSLEPVSHEVPETVSCTDTVDGGTSSDAGP